MIVRSSAAIAAVGAGIDVEVLREGTQRLPHRLGARERRIRVRDPGLTRNSRIHARVHQVDRACRPVLPHEAVEDLGIDLIQAEQVGREMPPELRVVAGLHHESARQLPLHVERPRVVLRQPARVVGLPVRDAAAVERFRHEEGRFRPRGPAVVPVERRAGGECRRGDVVPADEAVPMRAATGVLHRAERARAVQTRDRVVVDGVDDSQARAETPRPRVVHRLPSGAARAGARELRRAQPSARRGVRQVRVEVGIAVGEITFERGRRVLVAHAVVHGELVAQTPVVLRVAGVVAPAVRHVTVGRDVGGLHLAEEERGERVAGCARAVERAVGQEAGGRSAAEVVGARRRVPPVAVVMVLLEDEAELPRVLRLHPGEIVGQGPQVVARTAPLGSAPVEIVVREINQREEQLRPRHVLEADLRAPALVAIVPRPESATSCCARTSRD